MNRLPAMSVPEPLSAISATAKLTLENARPLEEANDSNLRARFAELNRRKQTKRRQLTSVRRKPIDKRKRGRKDTDGTLSPSAVSKRIKSLLEKCERTSSPNVDILTVIVTKSNRGKVRAYATPYMQWLWNQSAVQDVFRKLYPSPRYAHPVFPDADTYNNEIQQKIDRTQMPAPFKRARSRPVKKARPLAKARQTVSSAKTTASTSDSSEDQHENTDTTTSTTTTTTTANSMAAKKRQTLSFEEQVY